MLEDFLLLSAQWEKNLHRQTPRSSDLPSSQADGREMGTLAGAICSKIWPEQFGEAISKQLFALDSSLKGSAACFCHC